MRLVATRTVQTAGAVQHIDQRLRSADNGNLTAQIRRFSGPVSFFLFSHEIELALQSRAHSSDLIFQKCPEAVNFLRFCFLHIVNALIEH